MERLSPEKQGSPPMRKGTHSHGESLVDSKRSLVVVAVGGIDLQVRKTNVVRFATISLQNYLVIAKASIPAHPPSYMSVLDKVIHALKRLGCSLMVLTVLAP